jgi:hypothetical protein
MILDNNAGGTSVYPVQIYALHFDGKHLFDFLVEPTHMRVNGRRCYRFVIRGFVVFIYVANHKIPDEQERLALHSDSTVKTYDAELGEFAFLRYVWDTVRETTRNKR